MLKKSRVACAALITVVFAALAFAGVPQTINYQGYLKDGTGTPVNTAVNVTFRLYSSGSGVNPLWSGAPQSVTPSNGIYSTQIGPTSLPFDRRYYLGVTVDTDPELRPMQQLDSVPYALNAAASETSTAIAGQTLTQLDSRYTDPTRPIPTPQQIATLRWDQVRSGASTIPVGANPHALVFDGSSIWVANYSSNSVQKINPATGTAGSPISVGGTPYALAFDGSSVWVANMASNNIMKINTTTGTVVATIAVGNTPHALAFDGSSIWVANYYSNDIMKINPTNGAILGTYPVASNPYALAFDGSSIWVSNLNSNSVWKINPTTGLPGTQITVGTHPTALASDGSSIWVANYADNSIQKINPISGTAGSPITVGNGPASLVFDGSSIWVSNWGSDSVMKVNPTTGAVGTPIPAGPTPAGLAFDGSSIWVANYSGNSVTKLSAAGDPVGVQTVGTEQIVDGTVTTTKIADGSITTPKLADGTVIDSKISGTISSGKLDLSTRVARSGDTMTGALNLPANGLQLAGNQIVTTGGSLGYGSAPKPGVLFDIGGELTVPAPTSYGAHLLQVDGTAKASNLGQAYLRGIYVAPTFDVTNGYANYLTGIETYMGYKTGGNVAHSVVGYHLNGQPASGLECSVGFGISVPNQQTSLCNGTYGFYQGSTAQYNYFSSKVGIGTPFPAEALTVQGNAKISGDLNVGGLLVPTNSNLGYGAAAKPEAYFDISGTYTAPTYSAYLLQVDGTAKVNGNYGQGYLMGINVAPVFDVSAGYANYLIGINNYMGYKVGGNVAHSVVGYHMNQQPAGGLECSVGFGLTVPNQQTSLCNGKYGFYQGGVDTQYNYFAAKVGIGTPFPAQALDILGNAQVSGNITAGGTGAMPVYNSTGAALNAPHMVTGSISVTVSSTVTLSGPAAYTSASSYACTATTQSTSPAGYPALGIQYINGSSFTLHLGTSGTVSYICVGT
jgi:YVTN family beta-propeller protein